MIDKSPYLGNDDLKTKEAKWNKKDEQNGKVKTIDLSLFEAPKKWPLCKMVLKAFATFI